MCIAIAISIVLFFVILWIFKNRTPWYELTPRCQDCAFYAPNHFYKKACMDGPNFDWCEDMRLSGACGISGKMFVSKTGQTITSKGKGIACTK